MAHFRFERLVKAKPDEFYAWVTNYTNDDHSGPNWPSDRSMARTVIEQDNQHAVLKDRYGRMEIQYQVKKLPMGVETEGTGKMMTSRGKSTLSAVPEGTKLQLDIDFMPRGMAKLFFPFMKGRLEKIIGKDVDSHIKDFYQEKGIPL